MLSSGWKERVVCLNGTCCNFEFICICLCWCWSILERSDLAFLASAWDISYWFEFFTSFSEIHFCQTLEYVGWSPWQLAQCSLLAHDLSSWPSSPQRAHMILCWHLVIWCPNLLTLETPQRVGNIRLNRNAEVSCLYQEWDLRGIKCKYNGACQTLLTVLKDVDSPDTGHTLISESLQDLILNAWYNITWSDHSFADWIGLSTWTSNCPERSFLMSIASPAIEWIAFERAKGDSFVRSRPSSRHSTIQKQSQFFSISESDSKWGLFLVFDVSSLE